MVDVSDIINQGFRAGGVPLRIEDYYEGSDGARTALEIYSQSRDELIEQGDWPFAFREVALTDTGLTPPTPWVKEYVYPGDCLRVRYVRPGPLTGGPVDFDPQPVLFRVENDVSQAPPVRTILCSLDPAVLIYNGRITNPATWSPGFTRALISTLGAKFAMVFPTSEDGAKAAIALSQQAKADAMSVDDSAPPLADRVTGDGH